jgi:hypothetical protein
MNVLANSRQVPDSKIVELWTVADLPLSDAKAFAQMLKLPEVPQGWIAFPSPKPARSWWPRESSLLTASNQWMEAGPDFRPTALDMAWKDNKIFLYYFGVIGSMRKK